MKIISTILTIMGILFFVILVVMAIAWAFEQLPPLTRTIIIYSSVQEVVCDDCLEVEVIETIETEVLKITCFTKIECPTAICQSGRIKKGEVALNLKHGQNKIVRIEDRTYEAKWISSYDTDIDIWFGETKEDYIRCLEFGVKYSEVLIN